MILAAKDVCRCARPHPDRTYYGLRSCRGCDQLLVPGSRRLRLDRLTRLLAISEPSAWAANGGRHSNRRAAP